MLPDPEADDMTERIASLLMGSSEPLEVLRIAEMLYGADEAQGNTASIRTRLNDDRRFENVSKTQVGLWIMAGESKDETLRAVPPLPGDEWDGETY